jgi:hypothetical protein
MRQRDFRQEAIEELQEEFGEDVVKEYRILFRGSSSKTRISLDNLPPEVFFTEEIDLAIVFARRKVGRRGGDPEVSAVLITNEAFERLQKMGAVRRRAIPDRPDKSEIILSREDVMREADIYHLPYDYR